ncbi:unnamed protein product, partial [Meganyctiphanes norvegica]
VKVEIEVGEKPVLNQYDEIKVKEEWEYKQGYKDLSRESSRIEHRSTHEDEYSYQCNKFDNSTNIILKSNQGTHIGDKSYQCNLCDKRFSMNNQLTRHQKTHTGEKQYR